MLAAKKRTKRFSHAVSAHSSVASRKGESSGAATEHSNDTASYHASAAQQATGTQSNNTFSFALVLDHML